jgi:hypothetical protein
MTRIEQKQKRKLLIFNQAALIRLSILMIILLSFIAWIWFNLLRMPGTSYRGQLPPLSAQENIIRDTLQQNIKHLGGDIGQRNSGYYENLQAAAEYLESSLKQAGYTVKRQQYSVNNQSFANLEVEIPGVEKPDEIVIVGAHYDSAFSSRGANDNGSGSTAVL